MINNKAQTSMEFMMIVILSVFVMIFSSLMLYNYAGYSSNTLISARVNDIGNSMVKSVNMVNLYGPPARRVVEYNMPSNLLNISIVDEHNLFLYSRNLNENYSGSAFYTEANMSGNFTPDDCTEGKKKFVFESIGNNTVTIKRWKTT